MGILIQCKTFQFKFLEALGKDPRWSHYVQGYEKFQFQSLYEKTPEHIHLEYKGIFASSRLKEVDVRKLEYGNTKMDTIADLYMSLNPYLPNFPESCRGELEESYRKYLKGFLGVPNGKGELENIHLRSYAFMAILEKE